MPLGRNKLESMPITTFQRDYEFLPFYSVALISVHFYSEAKER